MLWCTYGCDNFNVANFVMSMLFLCWVVNVAKMTLGIDGFILHLKHEY